ncbi:MAG TPA: HD domain-containing protein [Rhodothermales bacterium]|nr:HD domain-containing protein [Rhodothermales bacterium]
MLPTSPFSPLLERAVELAAEWHEGTYRKSRWRPAPFAVPPEVEAAAALRIPVMAHVTAVALAVQRAGWDDATVAAAFLHDVLEDGNRWGGGMASEALAREVGAEVVRIVEVVTEPKRGADGHHLPWRARKEAYLAQLAAGPPEAAAVSLADRLHNTWTMCQALEAGADIFTSAPGREGLRAGPEEQVWFLNAVLEVDSRHADPRLHGLHDQLTGEVARFTRLVRADV